MQAFSGLVSLIFVAFRLYSRIGRMAAHRDLLRRCWDLFWSHRSRQWSLTTCSWLVGKSSRQRFHVRSCSIYLQSSFALFCALDLQLARESKASRSTLQILWSRLLSRSDLVKLLWLIRWHSEPFHPSGRLWHVHASSLFELGHRSGHGQFFWTAKTARALPWQICGARIPRT